MDNLNTYFLVRALKKNDMCSLEKLHKIYYSKLFAFAKKFESTTMQPDDFVQQTFIKLWENRSQLNEDVILDKQIFTICRNLILNQLKRDKKMQPLDLNDLPPAENKSNEDDGAKDIEKLHILIDRLPKKRKEIFILHKLHRLSYEEISTSLNISKKTIANHIYLASSFLKSEFKKNF